MGRPPSKGPATPPSSARTSADSAGPRGGERPRAPISRKDYATLYGPTTGDAVRLGDTSLFAEIEHDFAVPGDECLHGGGKTLRDGMGLSALHDSQAGALDMLISNVVVLDPVLGVVKGDLG